MSLKGMGFTNVILMGDSGGNQGAMKEVAATLDEKYQGTGARVYFIPEYYDYASLQKYDPKTIRIDERTKAMGK